jgi:hypothetical protein
MVSEPWFKIWSQGPTHLPKPLIRYKYGPSSSSTYAPPNLQAKYTLFFTLIKIYKKKECRKSNKRRHTCYTAITKRSTIFPSVVNMLFLRDFNVKGNNLTMPR